MDRAIDAERIRSLIALAIGEAGSEEKLGKATGYSQNAIWHAKRNGRVSAEMAVAIDRATGGRISKANLRPDLFPASGDLAQSASA